MSEFNRATEPDLLVAIITELRAIKEQTQRLADLTEAAHFKPHPGPRTYEDLTRKDANGFYITDNE